MEIIILGALPHTTMAKESEAYLPKQAPHFTRLLQTHSASTQWFDLESIGCTPYEYYQLQKAHYQHLDGYCAKGLGILYAYHSSQHFNTYPSENIYLMELSHAEMGLNNASLFLYDELGAQQSETLQLFETVKSLFEQTPFTFLDHNHRYALIDMGADFNHPLPSPSLLATGNLNDWYRQLSLPRELRALLNEVQMTLFNHPVNQAREQKRLKPLNHAWIYGGAQLNHFMQPLSNTEKHQNTQTLIIDKLYLPHLHQDWGTWLATLPSIDEQLNSHQKEIEQIQLIGFDRIVTLTPDSWVKSIFNNKNNWKQWWSLSK
ncbi:hypothetical protein [Pelistega indica]|nr:hypothetical protein [Pelistega indica]